MSENSNLITDLVAIYDEKKCTYRNESRELLWRCSLKQPTRSLERVQAIDFSTMVFGLSTLEPKVGNIFYKKFSGK